eukprot:7387268-Prymnesium_polylepis.1
MTGRCASDDAPNERCCVLKRTTSSPPARASSGGLFKKRILFSQTAVYVGSTFLSAAVVCAAMYTCEVLRNSDR